MADEQPVVPDTYDTGEYDLAPDDAEDSGQEAPEGEGEDLWDPDRAKKAMSKKNQENKALRERLKALEKYEKAEQDRIEAEKTAQQKLEEAPGSYSKLQQDYWRLQIALDKGLTPAQAKRLVGNTFEELDADADEFLTLLGPASTDKTPAPTRRAKEVRGGAAPDEGSNALSKDDKEKLVERLYLQARGR